MGAPVQVVMDFLACSQTKDWGAARALLAPGFTRTGPQGSVISGREPYLGYLQEVVGQARSYQYTVQRCVACPDGPTVLVEVDEVLMGHDGEELKAREAMIFDLTPDGRLLALSVYARSAK